MIFKQTQSIQPRPSIPLSQHQNYKALYSIHFIRMRSGIQHYAGINLTGYHSPPGLTPGPLIFFRQNPRSRDGFSVQTSGPRVEETKQKSPPPGITCQVRMPKIMEKEHNSIKAVSFHVFRNCPFDNYLLS